MTRLLKDDIAHVVGGLHDYDARLRRMTGVSLRGLACKAAGLDEAVVLGALGRVRIASVPITSGLGLIGGFSESVASIVSYLGFETFVTKSCDDTGMVEGIERGAEILMFADDERFVAIVPGRAPGPGSPQEPQGDLVPEQDLVVDNSLATALGFVTGLELMKGGLSGQSALVLGCGPVGVAAAKTLIARGAKVGLCDIDRERALVALGDLGGNASNRLRMEETPAAALGRYALIFDATNSGSFIESAHLTPESMVAAPGMPCALTREAMKKHRGRVLHDALEIGTATMAVQAVARLVEPRGTREGEET